MAISGKYGKLNIPKVGENEPVFVLRAQDRLAAPAIQMYRALVSSHGVPLADSIQKKLRLFKNGRARRKCPTDEFQQ